MRTLFLLSLSTQLALGIPLEIANGPEAGSARFQLPYSLGTHSGFTSSISGTVSYDAQKVSFTEGRFRLPILSLTTHSERQDCHMWEALGLDYSKSEYPEDHVCESGKLPAQGPNAIAHPEILFIWKSSRLKSGAAPLEANKAAVVEALGYWEIHGVKRDALLELKIELQSPPPLTLHLTGQTSISLPDFGIQVKPFLFVSVKETATVTIDLLLRPRSAGE